MFPSDGVSGRKRGAGNGERRQQGLGTGKVRAVDVGEEFAELDPRVQPQASGLGLFWLNSALALCSCQFQRSSLCPVAGMPSVTVPVRGAGTGTGATALSAAQLPRPAWPGSVTSAGFYRYLKLQMCRLPPQVQ